MHDINQKPSFMADCAFCKPHIVLLNKSNEFTLISEIINYFYFVGFTELIINRRFLRAREISRQMVMYTYQLLLGIYSTSCTLHCRKRSMRALCIQFNADQVPNITFSFNHYGVLLNGLRTLFQVSQKLTPAIDYFRHCSL